MERMPRTILRASARVTEWFGRNVPSEYPETAPRPTAVLTYGRYQESAGTSRNDDAFSEERVFPEAMNAIFKSSARVTGASGRNAPPEPEAIARAFTKAIASALGCEGGTSEKEISPVGSFDFSAGFSTGLSAGFSTGAAAGFSTGLSAVLAPPPQIRGFPRASTASRYTSGFTVNLRAFSIPRPRFTASRNPSPASLASPMLNGQYGWNGASFRSI